MREGDAMHRKRALDLKQECPEGPQSGRSNFGSLGTIAWMSASNVASAPVVRSEKAMSPLFRKADRLVKAVTIRQQATSIGTDTIFDDSHLAIPLKNVMNCRP